MDASITPAALQQALRSSNPPLVVDVRKNAAFLSASDMIRGALRRDPERLGALPRADSVVVYCVHGHEVSQGVAKALGARYLEGGIEHWDGERLAKPAGAATRWVTRERPKVDRIACPWLIRRFIDAGAEFLYVPAGEVLAAAKARSAIPYDVPDVEFTHVGGRCRRHGGPSSRTTAANIRNSRSMATTCSAAICQKDGTAACRRSPPSRRAGPRRAASG